MIQVAAFRFVLGLTLFIGVLSSAVAQTNDAALVDQFFPERLIATSEADFAQGGPPPARFSNFGAADLNNTGQADFLVAAYTNGFSAVVRVLKKQGTSAIVVAEPAPAVSMFGIYPYFELVDLDNDSRPEIVVTISGPTGTTAGWIFKWTGSALNLLSPTETEYDGDLLTLLGDADFVDITGDGIPELINPPVGTSFVEAMNVYQLVGGSYKRMNTYIYDSWGFVRSTSAPTLEMRQFEIPDPTKSYVMIISNGDMKGDNRASSVEITLNSAVVAGASQFNQKTPVLRLPISVENMNVLGVKFADAPRSEITVSIATE